MIIIVGVSEGVADGEDVIVPATDETGVGFGVFVFLFITFSEAPMNTTRRIAVMAIVLEESGIRAEDTIIIFFSQGRERKRHQGSSARLLGIHNLLGRLLE